MGPRRWVTGSRHFGAKVLIPSSSVKMSKSIPAYFFFFASSLLCHTVWICVRQNTFLLPKVFVRNKDNCLLNMILIYKMRQIIWSNLLQYLFRNFFRWLAKLRCFVCQIGLKIRKKPSGMSLPSQKMETCMTHVSSLTTLINVQCII
jgi:hypothetical protein